MVKHTENTFQPDPDGPAFTPTGDPTDTGIFQVTVAEKDYGCRRIGLIPPDIDSPVAELDIRYPVNGQVFRTTVAGADAYGPGSWRLVPLDVEPGPSLYGPNHADPAVRPGWVAPAGEPPDQAVVSRLREGRVETEFTWMEGCLLDALIPHGLFPEADNRRIAQNRLERWTTFGPGASIGGAKPSGVENTLPFAAIACLQPDHPSIDPVLAFWAERIAPDGCIRDGKRSATESAYTSAYPLALIGRLRGREDLLDRVEAHYRALTTRHWKTDTLWLRMTDDGTEGTFRNWARGVCWFTNGLTRGIRQLRLAGREPDDLIAIGRNVLAWAIQHQRSDSGLWGSYIDDPDTLPDTSGSAGIATACALAAQDDWFPEGRSAAERALAGFAPHLTPDGWVDGATQHNCGGDALQRGPYRVIHGYTLGLYLQLRAGLEKPA
ncbi:MAG: glycoside hydrolase family 88 protein [Opitutales bacterium]